MDRYTLIALWGASFVDECESELALMGIDFTVANLVIVAIGKILRRMPSEAPRPTVNPEVG